MRHYRTHGRIMRVFRCPRCGYVTRASKRADRKTKAGHRKGLWCPYCQKKQQFIQISR